MPSPPIISEHHAGTFTNIGLSHFSYIGPNAPHEGPPGLNPDLLSPKSRRRLQKRLYMRRHRAKLQGHLDSSQSPTATFPGRLKAGRKPKKTSAPSTTCTSDIESDDQQSAKPKQNKSGLTLPYKLRAIFSELGIDAAYLRAQRMDLIHFSALANLRGCVAPVLFSRLLRSGFVCRLYNTLERGPSPDEDEVPKGVDATLVQHLQAAVVVFVTDVMHRAIVWKERQIRLKKHSLAWRTNEYVRWASIVHRQLMTPHYRLPSTRSSTRLKRSVCGITATRTTFPRYSPAQLPRQVITTRTSLLPQKDQHVSTKIRPHPRYPPTGTSTHRSSVRHPCSASTPSTALHGRTCGRRRGGRIHAWSAIRTIRRR